MSTFASKWPVLQEHRVTAGDADGDGVLRDDRVEQWIAAVVSAYLDECRLVQQTADDGALDIVRTNNGVPTGAALGRPDTVVISAGATEIYPTSFTVGLRIRAFGRDSEGDGLANATVVVQLVDRESGEPHPLGDDIRDELIALQHAARHAN